MIGTLINVGAILVGGTIGLVFRSKIPRKYINIVFQGIGLFTLFVGVAMSLKTNNYLILVMSIVLGGVLGTLFMIDKGIENISDKIKRKAKSNNSKFPEGLVTAFFIVLHGLNDYSWSL